MWKAEMINDGEVVCYGVEDTPEGACFDLIRTIMNDWKAGTLAKEVYEGIYSASDSLHDFGGNVAYLVGGILTGSSLAFHGTLDECEAEFLEFLRDVFEEEHPVWKHVDLSEVDETEQE